MSVCIVVDTSVFVAALRSADGSSREILRQCLREELLPIIGQKLFLEYLDVLDRPDVFSDCPINPGERKELLHALLSVCRWVEVFFLWRPNFPDEGDNHVMELAVAGGAAAVITYNVSDFRGELHFPKIQILRPAQFLRSKR